SLFSLCTDTNMNSLLLALFELGTGKWPQCGHCPGLVEPKAFHQACVCACVCACECVCVCVCVCVSAVVCLGGYGWGPTNLMTEFFLDPPPIASLDHSISVC